MQPLYIDVESNSDAPIMTILYGVRGGINSIVNYLKALEMIGVNHVCLNLRFNQQTTTETLALLADKLRHKFVTLEEK